MIVLDVESTGLNPRTGSIVSLGAVDFFDPTNQFYEECRVWEGAEIHDEALAINGFSREAVLSPEKQSEADLIASFVAWATDRPEDRTLAAQNVSFDLEFVQAACARADIDSPFAKRTIDTHSLVWMHMVTHGQTPPLIRRHSAISLDVDLRYCGLPPEPQPHNALTGALAHAEVIARVAYTKNIIPDFSSFPIPFSS